jgi:hypothetical protein
MAAAYHTCRRARREDIRRALPLWEHDKDLYDSEVWCNLPALLENLWERDLVSFAIIESVPSPVLPRLFGGISFVHAEFIVEARASSSTLPNFILGAAMRGHEPFLTPREVAKQNGHGTLNSMNFLGNIGVIDLTDPELANFYATSNEGYMFLHSGYAYSAMWHEVWNADHVTELQNQGLKIERTIPLSNGRVTTLMSITAKDAVANPYARFSGLFFPPKPLFGFSAGEQQLIELALLESSDEQAAKEIHLSDDAVKKRWRSIYRKVEMVEPELVKSAASGAMRRRTLLHYLLRHLEELRPYSE